MTKPLDLTGQQFGRWEAVADGGRTKRGGAIWRCVCDCGNVGFIALSSLRNGDSKSCGCIKRNAEHGNRFIDRTGQRLGKLRVVAEAGRSPRGQVLWRCVCDCGKEKTITALRTLKATSCGCNRHNMARTPEYRTWANMKDRCENPNCARYRDYGGRGITVCDAWQSFEAFYADMGPRPPNGTIERIDNHGNYEPMNCRWASNFEQQSNRRNNRRFTIDGRTQTLAQWVRESEASKTTIARRLDRGWSPKDAVFTPPQPRNR